MAWATLTEEEFPQKLKIQLPNLTTAGRPCLVMPSSAVRSVLFMAFRISMLLLVMMWERRKLARYMSKPIISSHVSTFSYWESIQILILQVNIRRLRRLQVVLRSSLTLHTGTAGSISGSASCLMALWRALRCALDVTSILCSSLSVIPPMKLVSSYPFASNLAAYISWRGKHCV